MEMTFSLLTPGMQISTLQSLLFIAIFRISEIGPDAGNTVYRAVYHDRHPR